MPVIISFCVSVGGTRPPLDTCHFSGTLRPLCVRPWRPFRLYFVSSGGFLGVSLAIFGQNCRLALCQKACVYAKRFEREPFIINTSFLAGHNWPSACTAMPAARTFWLILPYTKSVFSSYFHHRIFFSYREFHVGMTS